MVQEFYKLSIYIYIGIICAGFFCFGLPVQAQQGPSIAVAPHTFELSVLPGEKVKKKVKVYNRGGFAIPFKIKMVNFGAIDETGEMAMVENENSENSALNWFEYDQESFIVDPDDKNDINFTINVPSDAKFQGYYAIALFEADISTQYFNQSKLQVIPNMGVIFMLMVEGGEVAAEPLSVVEYAVLDEHRLEHVEKVANFVAQPFLGHDEDVKVIKSEEPKFLVKIKNNDPYHKKLSGDIKLSGLGWKLDGELDVPEMTILPGMTRKVLVKGAMTKTDENDEEEQKQKGSIEGGFGLMEADLKIETDEEFVVDKKQLLVVYSWKLVLFLIFSLTLVLAGVTLVMKKVSRKLPKSERQIFSARALTKMPGRIFGMLVAKIAEQKKLSQKLKKKRRKYVRKKTTSYQSGKGQARKKVINKKNAPKERKKVAKKTRKISSEKKTARKKKGAKKVSQKTKTRKAAQSKRGKDQKKKEKKEQKKKGAKNQRKKRSQKK